MQASETLPELEVAPVAVTPPAAPPTPSAPKAKIAKVKPDEDPDALDDEATAEPARRAKTSSTLERLKTATHMEVKEWLAALASETPIQVIVSRKEPKTFADPVTGEQKKVDGTLQTYDRMIDEQEIQQRHGGGFYQLMVRTKTEKGRWEYFAARSIDVAGDPRLDDVPRAARPIPPQAAPRDPTDGKLGDRMMDLIERQALDNKRPAPVQQGPSLADIAMMMEPFKQQISSLTQLLASKDAELAKAREPATDPFRDKMLNTLMDGESARVTALRTQHESEIRQLKEGFGQTEARLRDQFQRDLDRVERAHDREMAAIKEANDGALAMAKQSNDMQKLVLERELKSLESQATKAEVELVALRAKRDPSIKEKIAELNELKELVGGDEDDDDSTASKIIGAVGNLPIVAKIAERFAGGEPVKPVDQTPQKPRMVRDDSGDVFMRTAKGLVPLKKKPVAITKTDGAQVEIPAIDPATVKQAVDYMEGAFRSGTEPEMFAATVRPLLPAAILGALRTLGPDDFLSQVAKLDGTSPLATQGGRNWVRKVTKVLLGDAD